MSIWYIGDLHGKVDILARIDEAAKKANVKAIVQVGDFGIHFPLYNKDLNGRYSLRKHQECKIFHYFKKRQRQNRGGPIWYTCGGNHDNWDKWASLKVHQDFSVPRTMASPITAELAPDCYWVPRGGVITIEGISHAFFGGAESVDRVYRREDIDWWRNETPQAQEFDYFVKQINYHKPSVIITHDCPHQVKFDHPKYKERDAFTTPRNLGNIVEHGLEYTPKYWFFGHHHTLQTNVITKIIFAGCGYHGQGQRISNKETVPFNVLSKKQFELVNWNKMSYS